MAREGVGGDQIIWLLLRLWNLIDIIPQFPHFWQFCDFWWTSSPESIMQEILQTFFAGPRLGGIQFPDFLEATELMDSCYRTHISMDWGHDWYVDICLVKYVLLTSWFWIILWNGCYQSTQKVCQTQMEDLKCYHLYITWYINSIDFICETKLESSIFTRRRGK